VGAVASSAMQNDAAAQLRYEVDAVLTRVGRLQAASRTLRSLVVDNEEGERAPRAALSDAVRTLQRDAAVLQQELERAAAMVDALHPAE